MHIVVFRDEWIPVLYIVTTVEPSKNQGQTGDHINPFNPHLELGKPEQLSLFSHEPETLRL